MTLLRRVRHLELRVFRLQELVAMGRILLEYIQGNINPSDSLTKHSDQAHMELVLECLRMEENKREVEKVKAFVERALDRFGLEWTKHEPCDGCFGKEFQFSESGKHQ